MPVCLNSGPGGGAVRLPWSAMRTQRVALSRAALVGGGAPSGSFTCSLRPAQNWQHA